MVKERKKRKVSKEKNAKIRASKKATVKKHTNMDCRTFEVKVTSNKMFRIQKENTDKLFCEAKCRRNHIIADCENISRDAKTAVVKVGDAFEERKFTVLSSQMIQAIYDNVSSEIKGLATKKPKGEKVGALKSKSYCNSVPLRQEGNTFKVDFNAITIKVAKIKKPFKVKRFPRFSYFADVLLLLR